MRSSRSTPLPRAATLAARPAQRPHTRLLARCCALALGTSLALPTLPAAAQAKPPGPAPATKPTKAQLAADLAAALQACSYDGSPVRFTPPDLSQGSGAEGASVVGEIMKYTGLPQNFDVVRGQVPNAAAVIVAGPDRIPRRVIAYNPQFMGEVSRATRHNNWAPVSIMAHEIGHHLSGHTIVPGGSQPPIELEADKFSGFVLYKMGATLADALKAIETLVPEQDGPTHPGRRKRVVAIADGWKQACRQQSTQCDGTVVASVASASPAPGHTPTAAAQPGGNPPSVQAPPATPARRPDVAGAPVPAPAPATQARPATPAAAPMAEPVAGPITKLNGTDVIPVPGPGAIPSKFDRFVMDETGLMHPNAKAKLAKAMYDLARDKDVEVVTVVVNNTQGMNPDEYAHALLRLLRVGKLEVGNGAVLVVAPTQGAVGVALGAGLAAEIGPDEVDSQLKTALADFYKMGLRFSKGKPVGESGSDRIADAADFIRRAAKNWEWRVNFPVYDDYAAAVHAERDSYDPRTSKTFRKIVRVRGVVTSVKGPRDYAANDKWKQHLVDTNKAKGRMVVELKTANGDVLLLELDNYAAKFMTAPPAEGMSYQFTVRASQQAQKIFNALSYDALRFN